MAARLAKQRAVLGELMTAAQKDRRALERVGIDPFEFWRNPIDYIHKSQMAKVAALMEREDLTEAQRLKALELASRVINPWIEVLKRTLQVDPYEKVRDSFSVEAEVREEGSTPESTNGSG